MEKADQFSSISFFMTLSSLPGPGPLGDNTTADCFCGVIWLWPLSFEGCSPLCYLQPPRMLWLQPGEWEEIEDEPRFARSLLSLASRRAVPLRGQLLLLCWVQNSQPTGHATAWHFRRSSEVCSLPAAPSVGVAVFQAQAVCKQSITVCLVQQGCTSSCLSSNRQGCFWALP